MRNLSFLSALALVAIPHVSAHYYFPHFIANGNYTGFYEYVREDTQGYMPMKGQYSSNDFRCNTGSQGYASKTGVYKVKAGDEIGFGTDFNALIQHPGPMQVYMSKSTTDDVRKYDGSGDWFKIYELGPQDFGSDGITWGVTDKSNFTFTLPKEVPSGQYLVRIEHIGVHGAGEWGGAEIFFNCAQIEIESDSTATPGPTVKIPGVYDGYEPGILFYMYRPWMVNYTMPGPVPFPDAAIANVTASGLTVSPTATSWSLPAVTRYPSSVAVLHANSASSRAVTLGTSSISRIHASSTSTPLLRAISTSTDSAASSTKVAAAAESTPVFAISLSTGSIISATNDGVLPAASSDAACGPRSTVTVQETVTVIASKSTCGGTITVTATVITTVAPTN